MFKLNYSFANRILSDNCTIILCRYFTHCTWKDWELGIRDFEIWIHDNVHKWFRLHGSSHNARHVCDFMDTENFSLTCCLPKFCLFPVLWWYCPQLCRQLQVCFDILTWYSDFSKPGMNFHIAILLHHVFCIALTNRAQHIFILARFVLLQFCWENWIIN